MTPTNVPDQQRATFIAGLHEFADYLTENSWLPIDRDDSGYVGPARIQVDLHAEHEDATAETISRVREIATRLGVKVDDHARDRTSADVKIGTVSYSLIAWHKHGRPDQLNERDAELERLRAEVAALRAAPEGPKPVSPAQAGKPADEPEAEPVTVYFSFGHGQTDPDTGKDLLDHYVTIVGPSYEACREAMFASKYGDRWAFEYPDDGPATAEWIPRWTEHERIVLGANEPVSGSR